MGELHLEVLVDHMLREYKVDANVGRPQVSYAETVRGTADKIEAASCARPAARASTASSTSTSSRRPASAPPTSSTRSRGGSIPTEFIPAVEKGVEEALENGVRAGFPMVDVRVTLVDGKYHDTDSSEIAFKVAGSLAFQEAAKRAKPVLLGPCSPSRWSRPRSTWAT